MEDAVEALKIGFAVLVFVIALTIFFRMVNLVKSTSDIILYSIDKSNYYGYSDKGETEHRNVKLKDIIPTIYRYNKENYGVTIIDKDGNVVARFDIETETNVQNWSTIKQTTKDNLLQHLNKILSINKNIKNISNESDLKKIFNKIYGVREETSLARFLPIDSKFTVEWNADEEKILKRLKSDIYGNEVFENHKAICNGNGLVKEFGYNKEFTEYVLEADLNEYLFDNGNTSDYDSRKNGSYNIDEAMIYRRGTNKMEIIYVEKE